MRVMQQDTLTKSYIDDTRHDGQVKRTIDYKALFFKLVREQDYSIARRFFTCEQEGTA